MSNSPASKETIQKLYQTMGSNFSLFVPQLSNHISALERLEQPDENEAKNGTSVSVLKVLLKLNIFSLINNLDLNTFLRANLRSTSNSEKRCNLKYVNVIIFEGYSYLFGFRKDTNNSLWKITKKLAEQINDEEFLKDINDIEQQAKQFEAIYAQQKDRDNRNLSIHYDLAPIKVYTFLSELSEDEEVIRANAYLKILESISVLIYKHIQKFQISFTCSINNYDIEMWESINCFPDENNKLFHELDEQIVYFAQQLDRIIAQCRLPGIIQEKLNLKFSFSERLQPLVESIYPGIHMFFIYLDLASAIRAFLSSELYFEKQLNLRRISIVVYEGFKHLYGYSNEHQQKSFWFKNISSILIKSEDNALLDSLTKIEHELKEIASDSEINNALLRERFVHYRYKDRDNILNLFHTLVKANPLTEMNKSLKLLNLLPKLIELNKNSTTLKYNLEQENIKSANNKTLAKIEDILSMIEQTKIDHEKKQEIKNYMNKIKNLL
ncbi:MAG: hypothetical protein QM594_08895 [Niabella sp.]